MLSVFSVIKENLIVIVKQLIMVMLRNIRASITLCCHDLYGCRIEWIPRINTGNSTCCMKPYNIKGAAMPIYAILARVTDIGTVHVEHGTGQSSRSTLMVNSSYLARPIVAIPRHLPVHGSVVTWSWSWRQSSFAFGPSKFEIEQPVLFRARPSKLAAR